MSDQPSTIWLRGFTQDGFQVSLTLDQNATQDTVNALVAKLEMVRAAGISPTLPGLEPGEDVEDIVTVVRREKGDGTPIIDFYPAWGAGGKFGAYKWIHAYLDKPEDIAEFEARSGLVLKTMPLYEGQAALTRKHGNPHRCEVAVKKTFSIAKKQVGQYEAGMPKYEWRYVGESPIANSTPAPPPPDSMPGEMHTVFADTLDVDVNAKEQTYVYTTSEDGLKVATTNLSLFTEAGFDEVTEAARKSSKIMLFDGGAILHYVKRTVGQFTFGDIVRVERLQDEAKAS